MFNQIENSNKIYACLQNIESFNLYVNGKKEVVLKSNKQFDALLSNVKEIFSQSRIMPAFGVSLHNETLNELKTSTWLEINFSSEQIVNDLNFATLLFKVEEGYGMNLIRKYNNRYEGRCIYLDFDTKVDLSFIINQTESASKNI